MAKAIRTGTEDRRLATAIADEFEDRMNAPTDRFIGNAIGLYAAVGVGIVCGMILIVVIVTILNGGRF